MPQERNSIKSKAVERLRRYYPYDEATRTFTIQLHYQRMDEILVDSHIVTSSPKIDPEKLLDVLNLIREIPNGYYADLQLTVDDCQGIDKDVVLRAIADAASERNYIGDNERKSNVIKAGILTVVGVLAILVAYVGSDLRLWGDTDSITYSIVTGFLNVFATVFIWEAVGVVVLNGNKPLKDFQRLLRHSKSLTVELGGDSTRVLVSEIAHSVAYYRVKLISDYALVFSSYFLFTMVIARIIYFPMVFFVTHENLGPLQVIVSAGLVLLMGAVGVMNLMIYKGEAKMVLPNIVVAGGLLALSIVNVVFVLIGKVAEEHIVAAFFVAICAIGSLVALGLQAYLAHKRKRS